MKLRGRHTSAQATLSKIRSAHHQLVAPRSGYCSRTFATRLLITASLLLTMLSATAATALADSSTEGFSLQVSPSPLVATIKPGQTQTLELQIRNTASKPQSLKMGLRAFSIDDKTGQVQLQKDEPKDVASFVSFSDPTFNVDAGQIYTQHVVIATPSSAGFSYSFAISIAQQNPPKPAGNQSAIQGSVAVFTLLNVDRPGATRKLSLQQLSISKHVYEYLPASVTVQLKNSGNTLISPRGTLYIQRHETDTQPLAALAINDAGGYILPGAARSLTTDWNDGFPHYLLSTDSAGRQQRRLSWDGGDFTAFRFGRYIAKIVAVYNDGQRDVPLTASVSFWVIPWRLLLILLLVVIIIIVGIVTILRKSGSALRRRRAPGDA